MNSTRRWHIILNPHAGRGRAMKQRGELQRLLNETALCYDITETTRAGEAREIARRVANESCVGIAAAGGDGTLSEVLNGVKDSNAEVPLAVLPMGTGNDFARCLGISNLRAAVDTILNGVERCIDLGHAMTDSHAQFFLNVAGCGFDAVVAERINEGRFLRGTPAYVFAVLQTLRSFRPTQLLLELDGEIVETRALLCAVANATSYGGGMKIAPRALLDDGFFDVCVIGDATRTEFLRAFPGVFKGTHESHPKVQTWRAREIRIESENPLPVLADGELIGTTPVDIRILPRVATMMAPATCRAIIETAHQM